MTRIELAELGDFLGTRFLGELVRKKIDESLDHGDLVEVSFTNVSGITHSFADEAFGAVLSERGVEVFRKSVRLVDLSPDIRSVIRFVFSERLHRHSQ